MNDAILQINAANATAAPRLAADMLIGAITGLITPTPSPPANAVPAPVVQDGEPFLLPSASDDIYYGMTEQRFRDFAMLMAVQ
ncbi:hypothetical protein HK101_005166, partial [Irineochytrium annulatum]